MSATAQRQAAYVLNGQTVSAEHFYRVACDPQRHVAVEACAGAGKTWMLVSRVLRALLDMAAAAEAAGAPNACATAAGAGPASTGGLFRPQDILAITFTKKAAGEMQQRLNEWLHQFAGLDDAALQSELQTRGLDADRARAAVPLARGLGARLQAHGREVQFRTFHGWFAALLRHAPLSIVQVLELPLSYELVEDDTALRARVWRPFLWRVFRDDGLRADYLAAVAMLGRSSTHKALEAALGKRTEFAVAQPVLATSLRAMDQAFPELAGLDHPTDAVAARESAWRDWAKALSGEKNKTPQRAGEAIATYLALPRPRSLEAFTALRHKFLVQSADRLNANLVKFEAAQGAERELQLICAGLRHQQAVWHQQRMARLTQALVDSFTALKRGENLVDMNDIESVARTLLSNPLTSGWLQERLDTQLRQVLIDEFQDTNPLQWQALSAWLGSYAGAGARAPTVFIVGDPKQSIYRFRRADPEVFMEAQAFVREGLGGDLLACDHTRRNALGVLDAVNAVFSAPSDGALAAQWPAMAGFRLHTTAASLVGQVAAFPQVPRAAVETGSDVADTDAMAAGEGHEGNDASRARAPKDTTSPPSPEAWRDTLNRPREVAEDSQRALECRQVARWVAQELRAGRLRESEVMVLARKRDRLSAMQSAFAEHGVRANLVEKVELSERPEVQDVLALLEVLTHPSHDLSLARVLKSPLGGFSDDDLIALAQRSRAVSVPVSGAAPVGWLSLLLAPDAMLSADLQAFGLRLATWQRWLCDQALHDALSAIYADAELGARFAATTPPLLHAATQAGLQGLLDAALNADGGRYASVNGFIQSLRRDGHPAPARVQADGVALLTVHGAKGLEADVVILLDTDSAPERKESMGVLIDWPGALPAPRRWVFLTTEKEAPDEVQALVAHEQAAREREELNALYVAMSRARARLLISSLETRNSRADSWWKRLHALADVVPLSVPDEGDADADAKADGVRTCSVIPRWTGLAEWAALHPTLAPPLLASGLAAVPAVEAAEAAAGGGSDERSDPATRWGLAMHKLLEWAPSLPGAPPPHWSAEQLQHCQQAFGLDEAALTHVQRMARGILSGEGRWAWDSSQLAWHGNEVDIVHSGQWLRMDRLVQTRDGVWWVLDHKSNDQPLSVPEWVAQLRRYGQAVAATQAGATVRLGFLTPSGRLHPLAPD